MSAPALERSRSLRFWEGLRLLWSDLRSLKASSIPNYLTASRIFVTAVILALSLWATVARFTFPEFGPNESYKVIDVWLVVYALASDVADGLVARVFGWMSPTGEWFDPLADKLFSIGVGLAITLEYAGGRYWIMYVLYGPMCGKLLKHGVETSHLRFNGAIPKATLIAKWKTAALMGAQAVLMANSAFTDEFGEFRLIVLEFGVAILFVSLVLSEFSIANYRRIARQQYIEWSE